MPMGPVSLSAVGPETVWLRRAELAELGRGFVALGMAEPGPVRRSR